MLLTPEGRIASWNRGAEALKGYTEAEILGKTYERFFPPEAIAAGKPRQLLRRAFEEGHVEDEGWRLRKDGSRLWADVVISAVHEQDGTLVGFATITRDLAERKAVEALAAETAQLQASNRIKSEILATMSHGLRTPLNAIIGKWCRICPRCGAIASGSTRSC